MSSIPGYKLEAYVAWRYSIVVDDHNENIVSLGIAEMIGNINMRPRLTQAQFANIMAFFEPLREGIEDWLGDFDEETQSWRDYGSHPNVDIDSIQDAQISLYVDSIRAPVQVDLAEKAGYYMEPSKSKYPFYAISTEERRFILREWSPYARWLDYDPQSDVVNEGTLDLFNIPKYRTKQATLKKLWDEHGLNDDPTLLMQHKVMEAFLQMNHRYRLVRTSDLQYSVVDLETMNGALALDGVYPTIGRALQAWLNNNPGIPIDLTQKLPTKGSW